MASINDANFFKRKVEDAGDRGNCPRTKQYISHYGGWGACGFIALITFFILIINAIDFFMGPSKPSGNNNHQRDKNHNNKHGR